MDVVPALVANREPTVLRKPGQCALHHPPVPSQLLAALYALSCYAALYAAPSQRLACTFCRRRLCRRAPSRAFPRSAPTGTLYGLYSVQELFEDHRVVDVGGREHHRQRDAPSVRNKVALRARLSFICRIRCRFLGPPFGRDGSRVEGGTLPIDLLCLSEAIQEDSVQPLPHPGLLPLA